MLKHVYCFCLLLLSSVINVVSATPINVVFLNPGHPDKNATGQFWANVTAFMDAAAEDLNIHLTTVYSHRNHILMKSLSEEILSHHPHYVILVNEKGAALKLIPSITDQGIPVFMLLNSLDEHEKENLSEKQKKLIIGSVTPNNYQAGFSLLKQLMALKQKSNVIKQPVNLLALHGDLATSASKQRAKGLKDALIYYPHIQMIDNPVANWSKEDAYHKVKGILQHQHIDVIWAANDAMAFGAKKAIEPLNLLAPPIIGGINWDTQDPHYPLDVSFGGHVALGAMSLVMINDIHRHKLPFKLRFKKVDIFKSSNNNACAAFKSRLKLKQLDGYDFSVFSHQHTKPLDFNIDNLTQSFIAPQ